MTQYLDAALHTENPEFGPRGSANIVVVDDDPTSLQMIAEILEPRPYQVAFATSGEDALALINETTELVLLDYSLPDIDGLEVCRRLKENPSSADIPIIIVTGSHDSELEARGLEVGAVDFVTKPFSASVLLARVATHIALRRKTLLLEALATHDGLTGALNRRHFDKVLPREWARAERAKGSLTLAMIDLDFFKKVNDTYGHEEGDFVLRMLPRILEPMLKRPHDILARFGGEEFVVLLPDTDLEGGSALCERMRSAMEETFKQLAGERGKGWAVTASIGCVCAAPTRELNPVELLRKVDELLYRAKAEGRNRVVAAAI